MHFSGAPLIPAPRARVWGHLLDPAFVAASAPAVESVQVLDPTHYRVVSALGVGFLKVRFVLAIELVDLLEPESARMVASGTAPGTAVRFESRIRLEELDPRSVRLHWEAWSEMRGAAAGLGHSLLEGVVRRLTQLFWQDFARRAGAAARP
ncbi:MAG TPA: carbon monoxide dehydrogenase subunit G [Gemmatimonadales bacterium]|nr:carbon monoxide dehydrogenase subunit G [Gemmatimonadales bacterium]